MQRADKQFADLFKYRELKYLKLDEIIKNPDNPREPPSRDDVEDLCRSIELVGGILVPLVVYYDSEKEKFVILDGERRYNAAKKLGLNEVPANVLPMRPEDLYSNLRTMFNIHLQREEWNPAAKALTLERIMNLRPELTDEQLSVETGISEREIQDLKRLLKSDMPRNLVQRALEEEFDASFLIEMEKYLEPCQKSFPEVFKEYDPREVRYALIRKVDEEWVKSPIEFRKIGGIRRLCMTSSPDPRKAQRLFGDTLHRMISEVEYSPEMALESLRLKLQPEVSQTFGKKSTEYLASLKAFAKARPKHEKLPARLSKNLRDIRQWLTELLK